MKTTKKVKEDIIEVVKEKFIPTTITMEDYNSSTDNKIIDPEEWNDFIKFCYDNDEDTFSTVIEMMNIMYEEYFID